MSVLSDFSDVQVMDLVIAELTAHRHACDEHDAAIDLRVADLDDRKAQGEDVSAAAVLARFRARQSKSATA